MEIPSGWGLEEQPRNEAGELLAPGEKPACVWYVLDAGGGSRLFIQPDCGYADAGPVGLPLEEPVVTAQVSVETGGGSDTGVLLDLADQILLSAEVDR
mgnify:CR=1 FL=1